MRTARWEIGSEFEWPDRAAGPYVAWPEPHRSYALAQHAGVAVWRQCKTGSARVPTLWIPDFFCPPVVEMWSRAGIPIERYPDDPRWTDPEWPSLRPDPGDLVLAVNYFGCRAGEAWQEWKRHHVEVHLLEDHSHDPVSNWASGSNADYAFASLRKTLPVPDGAIVWSPTGRDLPPPPTTNDVTGSALKLAAMVLKRDYLAGRRDDKAFRAFQVEGEAAMLSEQDLAISPWSTALLAAGFPTAFRDRRRTNWHAFVNIARNVKGCSLLDVQPGAVGVFNPVIVLEDRKQRDAVRAALVQHNVYPPVHWVQSSSAPPRVVDLADRILTMPLDQRYDSADAAGVARIVAQSIRTYRASSPL
jgi:hypothetical protein